MTKVVYAASDISPEVWTPPRGVVVLPLEQHPAFVAEGKREILPPGERRSPGHLATLILAYFRDHPPADVYAIAAALGQKWRGIKATLRANPELFQRRGSIDQGNGNRRTIWGLFDPTLTEVIIKPRRLTRAPSNETQRIYDYLVAHGPATNKQIAEALNLERQQVKNALERGSKLFRSLGRQLMDGKSFVLWAIRQPES